MFTFVQNGNGYSSARSVLFWLQFFFVVYITASIVFGLMIQCSFLVLQLKIKIGQLIHLNLSLNLSVSIGCRQSICSEVLSFLVLVRCLLILGTLAIYLSFVGVTQSVAT